MVDDWKKEVADFRCLNFYPGSDTDANRLNRLRAVTLQENVRREFTALVDKLSDGEVIDFEVLKDLGTELWILHQIRCDLQEMI